VTIDILPAATFDRINDTLICPGSSVQFDLNIQQDSGVNYRATWTPGTYLNAANIPNPVSTPLNDITYHIVITASNNSCRSFDTVTVSVLDGFNVLNAPDTAICEGDEVEIRAVGDPAYTYEWTSTAPLYNITDPTSLTPTITPGSMGKHTYTLTARADGCPDSTASINIEVQPIPTVTLPEDTDLCYGDTMKIFSDVMPDDFEGYSYSWNPGQALDDAQGKHPIFSGLASTTLTLTVSSSAGCQGQDDISLTVLPSDFMSVSADTSICPNEQIQIHMTGVGLQSFFWESKPTLSDPQSASPYVWPDGTQYYYVYGRDTNRCYDTQMVKVTVKPGAVIDLPDSVVIYPGEPYQMDPSGNALYYSWFPEVGLSDPRIANPIVSPEADTRYYVIAHTAYGCEVRDSIDILVSADNFLEMPNAFTPTHQSNSLFKPQFRGQIQLKSFTIFNRWGQKVFETSDETQGWDGRFQGEAQPAGVYIYVIEAQTQGGRRVQKQGNLTLIR